MTPEQFKAECCTESRPDGCPVLMMAKINQLEQALELANKRVQTYEPLMTQLAETVGGVAQHVHSVRMKSDHPVGKRPLWPF